jgi:hypothetical protein
MVRYVNEIITNYNKKLWAAYLFKAPFLYVDTLAHLKLKSC